jgi:hypothetical protein
MTKDHIQIIKEEIGRVFGADVVVIFGSRVNATAPS